MRYRRVSYLYGRLRSASWAELAADPFLTVLRARVADSRWRPAVDLYETGGELVVHVELAGVSEDDIDISVYPDALLIDGVRRCARCGDARFHRAGILHGPFRAELPLPREIDIERASARLERGLLEIHMPLATESLR